MPTNNPPSPIEFAQTVVDDLNKWLMQNPVIQTEDQARELKPLVDRAKAAFVDIESERVAMVDPLNRQVKVINETHKHYHNIKKSKPGLFDKVLNAALQRLQAFILIEEARREREAKEARQRAEEAERIARAAEVAETAAHEEAEAGVVDIDVQRATSEADAAFSDFQRASRFAEIAEKDAAKVKVAGGFGRSISIKNKEELIVTDWKQAIVALGLTDQISDSICTAARNFRKEFGELPPGVERKVNRAI